MSNTISFKSRNTIKGYKTSKLAKSENADCVVCAIASAFGVTYNQAHKFAKETYGRKDRQGTSTYQYHYKNKMFSENQTKVFGKTMTQVGERMNKMGRELYPTSQFGNIIPVTKYVDKKRADGYKYCQMTVGTFIKKYNKGTFILSVSGHTFTVKDGVVIGNYCDSTKMRVRVQRAWEIK